MSKLPSLAGESFYYEMVLDFVHALLRWSYGFSDFSLLTWRIALSGFWKSGEHHFPRINLIWWWWIIFLNVLFRFDLLIYSSVIFHLVHKWCWSILFLSCNVFFWFLVSEQCWHDRMSMNIQIKLYERAYVNLVLFVPWGFGAFHQWSYLLFSLWKYV